MSQIKFKKHVHDIDFFNMIIIWDKKINDALRATGNGFDDIDKTKNVIAAAKFILDNDATKFSELSEEQQTIFRLRFC